jgi:hypothetical protein
LHDTGDDLSDVDMRIPADDRLVVLAAMTMLLRA